MDIVYGMVRQTARFDLRIDPELREAIEEIAKAKDRSVAWIVREALTRYVEQEHRLSRT
jgi:predicted transcriptional regulator